MATQAAITEAGSLLTIALSAQAYSDLAVRPEKFGNDYLGRPVQVAFSQADRDTLAARAASALSAAKAAVAAL